MKRKRVQLVGVVFALVALLFFSQTFSIEVRPNLSEPGPQVFPMFAEAVIFICALIMILFPGKKEEGNDEKPWLDKKGWKKLGICLTELVIYSLLLAVVGFIPASVVMMMVFIYTLKGTEKANLIAALIIAIGFTAGIYFLFTKGFSIMLPDGILFG